MTVTGSTRRRGRRAGAVALVLLFVVGLLVRGPDPVGASEPLVARGSIGQVATWGHAPGAPVELLAPGGAVLATAPADAQGAVLFRELDPGSGYAVRSDAGTSDPLTVTDAEVHPGPETYEDVTLAPGYGYLPTRDGTLLSANVVLPLRSDDPDGPWPVVVTYSGYDPSDPAGLPSETLPFLLLGYVVVGVNMRGTGCSGGAFDYFEPAQLTDGYDVIETVARQDWSNGDVGMVGISYPGISQLYVAATQPPSLDAITPLSPYSDAYRGILYPGGIRNEGFALDWALDRQQAARPSARPWARARIAAGDATCADNQVLRLQSRDLDAEIRPERFDEPQLRYLDIGTLVSRIEVPTYLAAQFQDEQTGGSAAALVAPMQAAGVPLKAVFTNGTHVEPLGPTELPRVAEFVDFHVGRVVPDPAALNDLLPLALDDVFGPPIEGPPNRFDPAGPYAPQKAAYDAEPPIRVRYENGGVAGREGAPYATTEGAYDAWPIPGTSAERWFLQPDGALGRSAPDVPDAEPRAASSYRYAPGEGRATTFDGGTSAMWRAHPDVRWESPGEDAVLTFTTPPATETAVYAGTASADLWVRSDAPDTDLEVVLTEVRPDGQEVYVQSGWLRASHRTLDETRSTPLAPYPTHAEEDTVALPPGQWEELRVPIFPFAHVVRPGSRLRMSIETPGGNQPFWAFTTLGGETTNHVAHSAGLTSSIALPRLADAGVEEGAPPEPPSCSVPGVTTQAQSLRGQPCRPDRAPRRPTAVSAAAGPVAGTLDVTWTAPEAWAGGPEPDGYEVEVAPGGVVASAGAGATEVRVEGVPEDVPVTARVRATFGGVAGPWSDASLSTTLTGLGPEARFVRKAWTDFLGRAPTAEEQERVAGQLVAGTTTRRAVVTGLAASPEWATAVVERLYEDTLGRPGDPGGVAFWAGRVARRELTVAQVAARLHGSAERLARYGGDTGAWIDDLYRGVLGREPDPGGRAHWVGVAEARGPVAVALAIYQSGESARSRVRGLYLVLLGRPADPGGLAFWWPRVIARGDIALAVDLASSQEYLTRAQAG